MARPRCRHHLLHLQPLSSTTTTVHVVSVHVRVLCVPFRNINCCIEQLINQVADCVCGVDTRSQFSSMGSGRRLSLLSSSSSLLLVSLVFQLYAAAIVIKERLRAVYLITV